MSAGDGGMSPAAVRVKEELEWDDIVMDNECDASSAAAASLYAEHEVKHELVLGPERLQQQDIAYTIRPSRRNNPPSSAQVDQLVAFMESRPELARGCGRTPNARHRNRAAWREIEAALNSGGDGCRKSSEGWSKYWKDKKGAVKRKASLIAAARRRNGDGVEDVPVLSAAEKKILAIMGGESFATGDVNLEINPFELQEATEGAAAESLPRLDHDEGDVAASTPSATITRDRATSQAEATPRAEAAHPQSSGTEAEPQAQPPDLGADDETISLYEEVVETVAPTLQRENFTETHGSRPIILARRRSGLQQSPRGAGSAPAVSLRPRRGSRRLHRSPPAQRRSYLASLTKKFIAIEERRVEAELITAKAHEAYARGQENLLQALRTLTDAVVQLVNK